MQIKQKKIKRINSITTASSQRSIWIHFVGTYTQLCRLHRLLMMDGEGLTTKCKDHIKAIVEEFDTDYVHILQTAYAKQVQNERDKNKAAAYYSHNLIVSHCLQNDSHQMCNYQSIQ
eukprot:728615_1